MSRIRVRVAGYAAPERPRLVLVAEARPLHGFAAEDRGNELKGGGLVDGELDLEVHNFESYGILVFSEALAEDFVERGVGRAHLAIDFHNESFGGAGRKQRRNAGL